MNGVDAEWMVKRQKGGSNDDIYIFFYRDLEVFIEVIYLKRSSVRNLVSLRTVRVCLLVVLTVAQSQHQGQNCAFQNSESQQ